MAQGALPLSLEEALQAEFTARRIKLIQLYRGGPYQLEVLFFANGGYWTVASTAPQTPGWHQIDLDDWLFGDLVDVQLENWIQAYSASPR